MQNIYKTILTLLCIIFMFGCIFSTRWSEEERQDFAKKCASQKKFHVGFIYFEGFDKEEVDTIKIVEKNEQIVEEVFYMFTETKEKPYDRIEILGYPDYEYESHHTYEFYIGKEKPYILENIEMIMWPQFTNFSENWGCGLGNFTINNIRFENEKNIIFSKRK